MKNTNTDGRSLFREKVLYVCLHVCVNMGETAQNQRGFIVNLELSL